MERREKEPRQSSLPSSLIPHLYSRPQQSGDTSPVASFRAALPLPASSGDEDEGETKELPSMRSTFNLPPVISSLAATSLLDDPRRSPRYRGYETRSAPNERDPDLPASSSDHSGSATARSMGSLYIAPHVSGQQYTSPISNDPIYHTPRPQRPHELLTSSVLLPMPALQDTPRSSWREGEAGPSSLIHATHRDQGRGKSRRGSSQPAQFKPQTEVHYRGDGSDNEGHSSGAREHGIEGFYGGTGNSQPPANPYSTWALDPYAVSSRHDPLRPSLLSERPYLSTTQETFPLSSFGAPRRTWSGSIPGGGDMGMEAAEFPLAYSPGSVSEISSDARPDDDGDEGFGPNHKGMKRGRGSDGAEENPRKNRNPRKTAVACNFCRGRKLRCNGARPSCYNCTVRKFECEYVEVQRRRGPGKAPKGSKSKKGARSESSTSLPPNDRTSGLIQEGIPTEYPPHTSVISLENFAFQTAETMPRYRSPLDSGTGRRDGHEHEVRPLSSPEAETDDDTHRQKMNSG
ncbi:hypothetical protein BDZ94DRAFT_649505 [Collybia nuda]|uniref:Zn(2)-C6 fungal-type domain-containing protein n=1 Tax=Collybia nuda TaxID=64659 RepID=A0A9P5Y8E1_9AGAR|nr:hypothetical protein BDZ94DRAFT_649505 [Collybia nuda]